MNEMPLPTHNRYPFSIIDQRKDFSWPDGKRLAFYVCFNLEYFAFGSGMGSDVGLANPPPNHRSYAWRDYGNRVGLSRMLDLMDELKLPAAHNTNSFLYDAHPEICDEFAVMNLELRAGKRRAEALHNLAERTGVEDLKKLVAVLVQTDRFGTSIAQSLRGHADYLRTLARQRAEEQAAKLAVKLVFPIFFCVLPSLFVVTIGPVLTKLIRDLLPMIEKM